MEGQYGYRGGFSDDDLAAMEYRAAQVAHTGARMERYEPDFTIEDTLLRGSYELGDRHMHVYDPVWGEGHIGDQPHDQLLLELARTPLFRRLQSIEQLTLGADHATMPNSMYFSRWEHIWGSLVFVRKMTEGRDDIDDRQRMVLQLRTLLSDVGHTAFSHLGDWMFQGLNGGEDLHDRDLKDILQVSGVAEILDRSGFSVEETVFPDVEDWVECPSPDLCVDRVDYGFREILRWGAPTIPLNLHLRELHNPQSIFEITEKGQLAFKDEKIGRYFAAGFSILPTEHWSHPVHRLQLQLFQSAVRSSVIDKAEYSSAHPREILYGIDDNFYAHFHTWPMLHLQKVMKDVAVMQRQIFIQGRRADLNQVFMGIRDDDWEFPDFPNPLVPYTWQSREFVSPYPPNIKIAEIAGESKETIGWDSEGLVVYLPQLKARAVDPPIVTADGATRRLSELDSSYSKYLAGQRAMMAKAYRATILMRPDVAERIVAEHIRGDQQWTRLLTRQRSSENLAEVIEHVEYLAAGRSFDDIREVDDSYFARDRRLGRLGLNES